MKRKQSFGAGLTALILAGCATQSTPSPTPTQIPASDPASPSPTPQPSAPAAPAFEIQPGDVPDSPVGSSMTIVYPMAEGFAAIGFDGAFGSILWSSPDGRSWTDVTPEGFASVGIVSVVPFEGGFVGVGRANTTEVDLEVAAVYRSDDGLDWRRVTGDDMDGQLIDVVATDAGLFAVGGVPAADAAGIWHSTDGESWSRVGPDLEHAFLWSIAEGGPGLVAVGWRRNPEPDLAVWTSADDGRTWELSQDPERGAGSEATDVIALESGDISMVGGAHDGSGGRMWASADGITWELAMIDGSDLIPGAVARTVSSLSGGLVAVGGSETMEALAWFSADGRSWEQIDGSATPNAYFPAAVSVDGSMLIAGATQEGTMETGIKSHAQIWIASLR